MATSKPRALVLGHSFARRIGECIDSSRAEDRYSGDFNLSNVCDVEICGVGGRTVDRMIKLDLEKIRSTAPNVVILELESNDVCDSSCDAATTALSLVALTELLLSELAIQLIVVCQILPRKRQPFEGYNDRVSQVNTLVRESLRDIPRKKFWNHRGLINPTTNIYCYDGIHLDNVGNRARYRSYRGAILYALAQLN